MIGVGFNPMRGRSPSGADHLMIGACFLVVLLLVAWALLG
jgi:hypothetical protein